MISRSLLAVVVFALACGPSATTDAHPRSSWKASSPSDASELVIRLDANKPWADAPAAIIGDMCPDAVLVWGDLIVDESVRPRAIAISIGDAKVLSGFLICNAYMETFLKMQTANPRLKAGHGGTADVKWHDGQLFMRRRWSAADIALGTLSPPPSDVFQKGETLAAIASCDDPRAAPAEVLGALARVPNVFLFGMFPLR